MGCLKPECRQTGRQTQDDNRDFTEEELQSEAALRASACGEVCSKMGHASCGGKNDLCFHNMIDRRSFFNILLLEDRLVG